MTPLSRRKGGRRRINDAMPSDGEMTPFPVDPQCPSSRTPYDRSCSAWRTGVAVAVAVIWVVMAAALTYILKKFYMQWRCWWQWREFLCKRIFLL